MARPEELQPKLKPENAVLPIHLLIGPTIGMFRMMEDWKLPQVQQIVAGEPWTEPRILVEDLIKFCNLAISGSEIVDPSKGVWVGDLEIPAVRAWQFMKRTLRRDSAIYAARRAFKALLGEERMKPWDSVKARQLIKALEEQCLTKT